MLKNSVMILVTAVSLFAYSEAEKPCARANEHAVFSTAIAPSAEQQKIDINYYALDFDMNIYTRSMRCEFTVDLSVLDTSLKAIELDYSTDNPGTGNITVREVVLDGDTVSFTHTNDLLVIPVPDTLRVGQKMSVQIYSHTASANRHNDQGFNWDTAREGIYTNSQPYDARDWWPCVDYPRDKADSVDIVVTVADKMTVASNGLLESSVDNGNGTKTWHWHVGYPIASYLVSLSIYEFYEWGDLYVNAQEDTLPIMFYTYTPPESPDPSYMTVNYRLLPEMIALYEEKFGPYPFMGEKYGHAEWGESYGMEHQTLTSMGNPTERRVAHELAHMWFGDMITCNSYHHIWLNEGFARYAEALWWEHKYGDWGYKDKMKSFEYLGNGTIYVEHPEYESIFGLSLSYNKPAWVLHMLRHMVGDEKFFEILQTYAADPEFKYKTATTEQFQAVCEAVSGLDLATFFQQWIYGELYPRYQVYWAQTGQDLVLEISQYGTVFDMPVDLRITTTQTVIDTVLRIDKRDMTVNFHFQEDELVTKLLLDPDNWVLNTTTYTVDVNNEQPAGPRQFSLEQNFPNPFNPSTTIPYSLGEKELINISVFNISGERVVDLLNSWQEPGLHQVSWNSLDRQGHPVEAGVYFCQLQAGSRFRMIKLLLLR